MSQSECKISGTSFIDDGVTFEKWIFFDGMHEWHISGTGRKDAMANAIFFQ